MNDQNPGKAILQPGLNVWKKVAAENVLFLIDMESYLEQLKPVLQAAKRSIWIIGWDFNPDFDLDQGDAGGSCALGPFLRDLADDNPELEIRILIWGEGPVFSGRTLRFFLKMGWEDHPRIHLHYDLAHPIRASHHQKIVAVDECFAFVGGMDLTAKRWDDRLHRADHPLRLTPDGKAYPPVHDVQVLVSGEAASALAEVARRRWAEDSGEQVPAHGSLEHAWPSDSQPHIRNCEAGIALTQPGTANSRRRTEAIRLTCDAIAAARHCIYIEAQYLASLRVTRRLAARLKQPAGPEVIIVAPQTTRGAMEQLTMGEGMARCLRMLRRADRHDRLRATYAVVPAADGGEQEILVHAKVVIIDDRLARVGSSNLNNRSEGFDTECDLAIEGDSNACRAAIVDLRNDLLAEHLDADKAELARLIEERGSVIAALDALNVRARGLRSLDIEPAMHHRIASMGKVLFDPKRPYWPFHRIVNWPRSLFQRLKAKMHFGKTGDAATCGEDEPLR
ncbi:phospholipase D-like domain-containing protein [Hoeflea sp. YIM 152468]|uniref:phospholipase D-like domain-containing protein n=1 Tax=Hoeflea sp. YIM 152468 TaxID=3031759 RepID=UPI0023DC904C|nr:phospholipase D-like domain-containing protein [Hoeflea sp. YIM 152468]MDF1609379.1 phospholipase D-like domain-containing protein [Hoeflea sp. YIM 152468]